MFAITSLLTCSIINSKLLHITIILLVIDLVINDNEVYILMLVNIYL